MTGLHIDDARVVYPSPSGPTTAVDGVDLDVAAGEVVALLGPSGCGKSSLLRAVAGLEPLAAGSVRWGEQDLADVPVHRRGFGLMFQDGQLFPHRDVRGNVAFGLRMAGASGPVRAQRVDDLLELVGLPGFGRRQVATLSGGEQQRVALARALAPEPRLLLLDEPLSALDRALRERLAGDLHDILRRTGTTALYVTHDHDEAFTVADRVAVMMRGRFLQLGTPAELWAAPAGPDVAHFLGFRVVRHDGRDVALAPHALVLAADGAAPSTDDPLGTEHPLAADHQVGTGELTGRVTAVGFSRGLGVVTVDLPDWGEQRAVSDRPTAVEVGDEVVVRIDPRGVVDL